MRPVSQAAAKAASPAPARRRSGRGRRPSGPPASGPRRFAQQGLGRPQQPRRPRRLRPDGQGAHAGEALRDAAPVLLRELQAQAFAERAAACRSRPGPARGARGSGGPRPRPRAPPAPGRAPGSRRQARKVTRRRLGPRQLPAGPTRPPRPACRPGGGAGRTLLERRAAPPRRRPGHGPGTPDCRVSFAVPQASPAPRKASTASSRAARRRPASPWACHRHAHHVERGSAATISPTRRKRAAACSWSVRADRGFVDRDAGPRSPGGRAPGPARARRPPPGSETASSSRARPVSVAPCNWASQPAPEEPGRARRRPAAGQRQRRGEPPAPLGPVPPGPARTGSAPRPGAAPAPAWPCSTCHPSAARRLSCSRSRRSSHGLVRPRAAPAPCLGQGEVVARRARRRTAASSPLAASRSRANSRTVSSSREAGLAVRAAASWRSRLLSTSAARPVEHVPAGAPAGGAHGLGGVQVAAPGEDRQAAEQGLLRRREQVVAPVERRAQRLLAGRRRRAARR